MNCTSGVYLKCMHFSVTLKVPCRSLELQLPWTLCFALYTNILNVGNFVRQCKHGACLLKSEINKGMLSRNNSYHCFKLMLQSII